MAKFNNLLVSLIIILGITLSACGSGTEYKRNPDYTYGTLEDGGIESVYELDGTPSQYSVQDYSDGVSVGSKGSYFITLCETTSGGVVAYGKGMYVYSPDKNDKKGVESALISECMRKKQEND